MTQIYTSNTVIVTPKASIVNYTSGDSATLVCDISVVWIDTTVAQRFLSHKWQSSVDGVEWTDLSNNTNYSSTLESFVDDITLYEYNIAENKTISTSLDIKQVSLSQNNHKFRCLVFLYNNDQNNIESVGSSTNITLNVSPKNKGYVLPEFDIPWDPMNPRGIIQGGNLTFDQNTKIELFKLRKDVCGTQWRIIETAYGVTYLSGNVTNGVAVGLPASYGPNSQGYPGYMELQFYCNNQWITQESWISLVGNSEHVFDISGPISPVTVSINGDTLLDAVSLGTEDDPVVFQPTDGATGQTAVEIKGVNSNDIVNLTWDGSAAGYASTMGIIPASFKTVSVPASYQLPATVTITGGIDDDLVINGQRVTFNNGAINANYTFTTNSRTFTVGVYNAICCGTGYSLTIAFSGTKVNNQSSAKIRENSTNILSIDQVHETVYRDIPANSSSWINTGVNLTDSSRLLISTTGSIQWSNNNFSGPDGVVLEDTSAIAYSGIPQSALVAKIGDNGTPFYVGSYYNSFIDTKGMLFLSINDNNKNDNTGKYSSAIEYAKADPIGIRVTTLNSQPYDSTIQDRDFSKTSLLTKIGSDSLSDASIKARKFTNTNVRFDKDVVKYSPYSIDYSDGGSSVAESDDSLAFPRDFTVEGWFYFQKNNIGYQSLIATYRDRDVSGWRLYVENNNTLAFIATNSYITWYWPFSLNTNYVPPVNQWLHIVVQRTGSTAKMYVNGTEIGSTNNTLDITSGYKIELGNYLYFGGARWLRGNIGEIRVSKFARYPQGSPEAPVAPFPKVPYYQYQNVDLSSTQKSATPVYDTTTGALKYYVFNSKNSTIGPYNKPGQLSLVYSYVKSPNTISQNLCEGYFKALDNSNRYFRKLAVYDTDCCYLGQYRPDDGYYVVTKRCDGQYQVVDSIRWYANNGYAIGDIIHPSDSRATTIVNIPASLGHPKDSATWRSISWSQSCCNQDGTKNYYELSDEVFVLPTPTPAMRTPTPTPTVTATQTPTPSVTPTITPSMNVPSIDPLFNSVSLLLRMNGSNNSTNISDSSLLANTITTTGNAVLTTSDYKFGGASLSVPSASTSPNAIYLNAANGFNFGSGNFTIEFYLKQTGNTQSGAPVFKTSDNTSAGVNIYYPSSTNSLVLELNTINNQNIALSMGSTDNTWNHYAVVRNTDSISTYKNGSLVSTTTISVNSQLKPSSGIVTIGGNINSLPIASINALVDDFRITLATRYSGLFTPPQFQLSNTAPPTTPTPTVTSSVTPTITPSSGIVVSPTPTITPSSTITNLCVAGQTWTPQQTTQDWMSVASSSDGTKLAAVVYNGKIYTSTDSGLTWTARDSDRAWYRIASSSDGSKLVAVVYDGQIYTSTDSGVTWTARESNRSWYSVASSSDGTKLVAVVSGGGQIYTSTDSGVTWTARATNSNWYNVASSSDGTKLVAVPYNGRIYTSTDSGVTWTARESARTWYGVASSSDGTKLVAVASGGQIYTSTDSGVTWTARESSRSWYSVASSSDGTKLFAAVYNGQIYISTDSGVSWTATASNRRWYGITSNSNATKLAAVVNVGQIYISSC